jgi:hypothetical protein
MSAARGHTGTTLFYAFAKQWKRSKFANKNRHHDGSRLTVKKREYAAFAVRTACKDQGGC